MCSAAGRGWRPPPPHTHAHTRARTRTHPAPFQPLDWIGLQVMTKICREAEASLDYYAMFKNILKQVISSRDVIIMT